MIKVLLVDDHEIVIDGLSSIIDRIDDIKVVGTALNAELALEVFDTKKIDVAVLDIEMPGMDGIELTKCIKEKYPKTGVLVLSMYKKTEMITGISMAGGSGYILKNRGKEELEDAIRSVAAGGSHWGKEVAEVQLEALLNPEKEIVQKSPLLAPLSDREIEVLKLVVEGLTSQEIAKALFITKATVSTHRQHIRQKMDVPSKAVIKFAIEHNLV